MAKKAPSGGEASASSQDPSGGEASASDVDAGPRPSPGMVFVLVRSTVLVDGMAFFAGDRIELSTEECERRVARNEVANI